MHYLNILLKTNILTNIHHKHKSRRFDLAILILKTKMTSIQV